MPPSEPFTLVQQPRYHKALPFPHIALPFPHIYVLGVPQLILEGGRDHGLHFTDADSEAW